MAGMKFEAHKSELIEKTFGKALFALAEQALTDCNYYVKMDQKILKGSSYYEIKPEKLTVELTWDTPYAKRQYYTGKPSHTENPNASLKWADKAARRRRKDWQEILEKGMKEALK